MMSSVFSVIQLRTFKVNDFIEMGQQLTHQTSSIFELWIEDQKRVASQIAQNKDVVKLCEDPNNQIYRERVQRYLSSLQNQYCYYENLPIAVFTDQVIELKLDGDSVKINSGEFIIDTANESTLAKGGMSYSYISEIYEGKDYYVSEIYKSIARGTPILVVSVPITSDGEVIGVAMVSPKMNYLTQLFVDSVDFGDSGYMFAIDSDNNVIAHKNRAFILNEGHDTKEIVEYIINEIDNGSNFFEANIYETGKYYYGRKVNISKENSEETIYIVLTVNKSEVFNIVHFYAVISVGVVFAITYLTYKVMMLLSSSQLLIEKEHQLLLLNKELEEKVKARTSQLKDMAIRDGMTGLYNHEFIHRYLRNLLESEGSDKQLLVAILDIDNFKKVNDTFGHQVGDQVIKNVASVLKTAVRSSDMVGRYGGEEFLIVFNNLDYDKCISVCERIRVEIEGKCISEIENNVTVSIGATPYRMESPESIIKRADRLMYQAKRNGKNQVVHDTHMNM